MIEMLRPEMPIWEISLRGSIGWLGLVVLVRLGPKRNAGHIWPNDLLLLIVVGGLATDAIAGGSKSTGDLLLMTLVVLLWGHLLNILEYRVPVIGRLLRHRQTALIENGRLLRQNMRREMVTEEELMTMLRMEGVDDPLEVASAYLEADGEISVQKR